jgi:hypothetical protein
MLKSATPDDRLANMYAYRKAKGLCYKCGLAYSKGHKCADTVQLHLVEEIWNQFTTSESKETMDYVPAELHAVVMSQAAQGEVSATKTMKFLGSIQGVDLLILLDSGSSHTFLSAAVASQLTRCSQICEPLSVQIANNTHLICSSELPNATW